MLQGHEDADAAGRWVDCACERDHQKQRVIVDHSKGRTRGDHQTCGGKQELAVIVPGAKESKTDGQERGTEKRRGRDDADLQRCKA
jgi:hypothetical protein